MQIRLSALFSLCGVILISLQCLTTQALATEFGASLTPHQKANVGKLLFTNVLKPVTDYQLTDYVTSVNISSSQNLYFVGFLSKPLSKSLADLVPELSAEQAINNGNYQFSFLINGKLIYTENLDLGAGTAKQKTQDLVLFKPFYSERNEDSWGRFLWMRFMHFGGGEALTEGQHKLHIEIRPYVKLPEVKIGNMLAKGELNIKVIKPQVSDQQIAVQNIQPDSGWKVSQKSFDQQKIQALNKRILQEDFKQITSIVVIKDGELLLEEYFNGANRDTLHNPRSVGKSIASTMLGIAIEEGHIESINQPISDFYLLKNFAHYSAQKAKVSLKNLLTMSTGFAGNDSDYKSPGNEENMYPTDDWVKFTLDLPMSSRQPNQSQNSWQYFTAGVVLLGDIIHQNVPKGLEHYTQQKLFKPLGIKHFKWQYTPQKVANTAGGLQLRTLDFAKYGQLYKNQGQWQGQQILPAKWAKASLSKQVTRSKDNNDGHYGYLFWNDDLELNNKHYEVAYATGNGGNKIFIFKDIPYVIVITATAYNRPYAHPQVLQMMHDYIMPAVLGD